MLINLTYNRLIVPPPLTLALIVLATTHIFYQVINFSPNTNQILLTASGCFIIYYRSQRSNILKLRSDKEFGLFVPLACISLGLKISSIYFIAYSGLINELGNGLAITALFSLFLKNLLFLKLLPILLVLLFFVPNIPYFEAYLSFPVRLVTSEIAEMIFVTLGQDISRSGTVIRLGDLKGRLMRVTVSPYCSRCFGSLGQSLLFNHKIYVKQSNGCFICFLSFSLQICFVFSS